MSEMKTGTIAMKNPPSVTAFAAAVGTMEGRGPLGSCFDFVAKEDTLGESSWEKSESRLQRTALEIASKKRGKKPDLIFAGDLLNQCVASADGAGSSETPFLGIFGACSTMAEGLGLAAFFADNLVGADAAVVTSSHFCSAERQFRMPLNYGGQRTPTAQWTATAAGCAIVSPTVSPHEKAPYIRSFTIGRVRDMGVTDPANMGAAMAEAAHDTLTRHFENSATRPDDYDLILTGDLGQVGSSILLDLFARDGMSISDRHNDCGLMLYDREKQDVHAGGSGCGCSASVLCGCILGELQRGKLKRVLFAATGALMSPTWVQQGETIAGVCHCVELFS